MTKVRPKHMVLLLKFSKESDLNFKPVVLRPLMVLEEFSETSTSSMVIERLVLKISTQDSAKFRFRFREPKLPASYPSSILTVMVMSTLMNSLSESAGLSMLRDRLWLTRPTLSLMLIVAVKSLQLTSEVFTTVACTPNSKADSSPKTRSSFNSSPTSATKTVMVLSTEASGMNTTPPSAHILTMTNILSP